MSDFQKIFIPVLIAIVFSCGCSNPYGWLPPTSTDKNFILFDRTLKGDDSAMGLSIAIAPDGIIWVLGSTKSTVGIGDVPSSKHKDRDAWLIGINPEKSESEQIIYNRCFGGDDGDSASSMIVAKDGTIWLAGSTSSVAGTGDIPASKQKERDVWVIGINPKKIESEQIIYNRCFGGDYNDSTIKIVFDNKGILWLLGSTDTVKIINRIAGPGTKYIWILGIDTKKSENEQIVYKRDIKGAGSYFCRAFAVAKDGTLWLVGRTNDTKYNIGNTDEIGDIPPSKYGRQDIWLLGLDPKKSEDKQIIYKRCFGGNGIENIANMVIDKDDVLWIAGETEESAISESGDVPKSAHFASDVWLLGIDTKKRTGQEIVYNRSFGKYGMDNPTAIAIDKDGILWLTGESIDFRYSKSIAATWLLGIDPKQSEDKQIIYNRILDDKHGNSIYSIAVGTDSIWSTGLFRHFLGKKKKTLDRANSGIWVIGVKR